MSDERQHRFPVDSESVYSLQAATFGFISALVFLLQSYGVLIMNKLMRIACASGISIVLGLTIGCASTPTQESTGQIIDSSVITTNVKAELASQDLSTLLDVEVETFRDVVQLSGFVDTQAEKDMAGEVASNVDGVVRVENNLIVKPGS